MTFDKRCVIIFKVMRKKIQKFDEGGINHRISNFTIPVMQTLGLLLALAVVYRLIDIGLDDMFRYWRVIGVKYFGS